MPLAYSYIRFSHPKQAQGQSLRRQVEASDEWCKTHGYTIAKSYRDLGVSARHGKNITEGALGAFLRAVEQGKVERGSALVIERLDRLSRDQIHKALRLLLGLIGSGIVVVSLHDQRVYREETIDAIDLVIAIVELSAAHSANEARIKRVQDAMDKRRERVEAGEILSGRCPGWLAWDKKRQRYKLIPERVEIVRGIYKDFLAGKKMAHIVADLRERRVPTLRGHEERKQPTRWSDELVRYILRSDAVIGRYTPGASVGKGGETRDKYYPAAVQLRQWQRVQAKLDRPSSPRPKRDGTVNLLSGLCRCAACKHPVSLFRANGRIDSLHCTEQGCTRATLDHRAAELAVLAVLRHQIRDEDIGSDQERRAEISQRLEEIAGERTDLEHQIDYAMDVAAAGGLSPERTAKRTAKLEARLFQIGDEEASLRSDLLRMEATSPRQGIDSLRRLMERHGEDRERLADSLREVIDHIVVNAQNQTLAIHLHEGRSALVLSPLSDRFRYLEDAEPVKAIQVQVSDFGDPLEQETELIGGNIILDRYPVNEQIYRRPVIERLSNGTVLIHPRQIAAGDRAMLSLSEAARESEYSKDMIGFLCRRGSVPGAFQGVDGRWRVPRGSARQLQRRRKRSE